MTSSDPTDIEKVFCKVTGRGSWVLKLTQKKRRLLFLSLDIGMLAWFFSSCCYQKDCFLRMQKLKKKKTTKLEFSKKSFNALTTPGTALLQDYFSLFLAILHGMKDFIPQSGIETIPHAVEALSLNHWTREV